MVDYLNEPVEIKSPDDVDQSPLHIGENNTDDNGDHTAEDNISSTIENKDSDPNPQSEVPGGEESVSSEKDVTHTEESNGQNPEEAITQPEKNPEEGNHEETPVENNSDPVEPPQQHTEPEAPVENNSTPEESSPEKVSPDAQEAQESAPVEVDSKPSVESNSNLEFPIETVESPNPVGNDSVESPESKPAHSPEDDLLLDDCFDDFIREQVPPVPATPHPTPVSSTPTMTPVHSTPSPTPINSNAFDGFDFPQSLDQREALTPTQSPTLPTSVPYVASGPRSPNPTPKEATQQKQEGGMMWGIVGVGVIALLGVGAYFYFNKDD